MTNMTEVENAHLATLDKLSELAICLGQEVELLIGAKQFLAAEVAENLNFHEVAGTHEYLDSKIDARMEKAWQLKEAIEQYRTRFAPMPLKLVPPKGV